eukprot:UN05738
MIETLLKIDWSVNPIQTLIEFCACSSWNYSTLFTYKQLEITVSHIYPMARIATYTLDLTGKTKLIDGCEVPSWSNKEIELKYDQKNGWYLRHLSDFKFEMNRNERRFLTGVSQGFAKLPNTLKVCIHEDDFGVNKKT